MIAKGKTMKKNILFTLIVISIAVVLPACAIFQPNSTVRGSGVLASETRSASGFDRIEITGSADVAVTFGDSESVVIEAEDNLLPVIKTDVRGRTLVIGLALDTRIEPTQPIRVAVTMKSFSGAVIAGSGSIAVPDLQTGEAEFQITGSGTITASGTARDVEAMIRGSGVIDCGDLQAESANATVFGSGDITVFASQSLQAKIPGSGNITYRGNPAVAENTVTGSGEIRPQ
jgi:hypothetical protein